MKSPFQRLLRPVRVTNFNWEWSWFELFINNENDEVYAIRKAPLFSESSGHVYHVVMEAANEEGCLFNWYVARAKDIEFHLTNLGEI